jgi:hypothetical protein
MSSESTTGEAASRAGLRCGDDKGRRQERIKSNPTFDDQAYNAKAVRIDEINHLRSKPQEMTLGRRAKQITSPRSA